MYPKKKNVHIRTCTQKFTAALFITAKKWTRPKCLSTSEWLNNMWYIHVIDNYLAIQGNKVLIHITTWIEHEHYYAKMKKPDTKDYIFYFSICVKCPE